MPSPRTPLPLTHITLTRHLDHDQFWKHRLTAGITTRVIKRYCAAADPFSEDDAHVAGLLHDIGVLVLDQHLPALYVEVNAVARRECISRADAERLVLAQLPQLIL